MNSDMIFHYPLQDAIADGVLVEIFKNRWQELGRGKPIVATAHLFHAISLAAFMEIWNEYVDWRMNIMPKLPEKERLFTSSMNLKTVWVVEDLQAFTIMYPEDY